MIGSGHWRLWELAVELFLSEIALYWGITLSLMIDLRDTSLHLGMIMSKCIFVEAYHFAWSFFTLGHDLSLDEVRYSLHVTTMTLRSGDSFLLDVVWLVVLLSSMFALEMLTLGYNPLIDDRFYEMIVYARHILSRDYLVLRVYPLWEDAFILGHSHLADFDIETPPPVMIVAFDGS